MNKYKLIGLAIALVLLIAALAAMQFDENQSMSLMLPIITVGLWALTIVDIISYKKSNGESKMQRGVELMRVISLGVLSVLLTIAVILSIIFR